jgi:predicted Zn-ribbon and HTH transcriptional regulator
MEVYDLVGNEYEVLEDYKRAHTKILMKHNNSECFNCEWEVTPHAFLKGSRCPICNASKGETLIKKYLSINKIKFSLQYSFDNLKGSNEGVLRFDFAIFYNKEKTNLAFLLEYDGEFHYKPIKNYKNEPIKKAEERLEKQQYHDQLKNKYCEKNKIPLLRIPYWDFENIDQILTTELSKYNLNHTTTTNYMV